MIAYKLTFFEFRQMMLTKNQVILNGIVKDQSFQMTIFRNTSNATILTFTNRQFFNIRSFIFHSTCCWRSKTANNLYQLMLSIAIDTCHTKNFTTLDGEIDVIQLFDSICFCIVNTTNFQNRIPIYFRSRSSAKVNTSSNHHLGDFFHRRVFNFFCTYYLAETDHCDPIRNSEYFCQLMTNKNNRLSFFF